MRHTYWIVLILFVVHLFFRFYDIENRNLFGFDQVDNAWAAKNIIVDHRFPLVGVPVKQNTGFYLGPAYYYLLTPIYWLFNLDPIASGIFAGVTSIFTFFTLFFIIKKLFSIDVALIAIFIHTVSLYVIQQERIQWNVNFIESVSLIIFYALFMVINGRANYLILLAIALGFSFHVHFTSIFFPILILLTLPFFPRNRTTVKYGIISFFIFIAWLMPSLVNELISKGSSSRNMMQYLQTYYHGFHLTRVMQLFPDAFIEFEQVLSKTFKVLKYAVLPSFILLYLRPITKERLLLSYLVSIWILVPWIAFSTYSGEISNYYFSLTRPIAIIALSFITWKLLQGKFLILKFFIIVFWGYYAFASVTDFFTPAYRPLSYHRAKVEQAIKQGKIIEFQHGNPQSFIYYIYKRNEKIAKDNKK